MAWLRQLEWFFYRSIEAIALAFRTDPTEGVWDEDQLASPMSGRE